MAQLNKKYSWQWTLIVVIFGIPVTHSFNIGVRGTTCSLDQNNYNDPCKSLYEAMCDGAHCKCPPGFREDKGLKKCAKGGGGGGGDSLDLPFEYVPGAKPQPKTPKEPKQPQGPPVQPPLRPQPQPANVPAKPKAPVEDPHVGEKAGGGIGGGVGLLLLGGLIYFCCCRGEKGKNLRSKLPFFKGNSQAGTEYQMQQQQPEGVQYPPAQPGAPPQQYPPQQYPNAPPPQAV